jgi:hypothetical protein
LKSPAGQAVTARAARGGGKAAGKVGAALDFAADPLLAAIQAEGSISRPLGAGTAQTNTPDGSSNRPLPESQTSTDLQLTDREDTSPETIAAPTAKQGAVEKLAMSVLGIPKAQAAQFMEPSMPTLEDSELPRLVKAVIGVESAGNPKAVSKAGAQGLMQVMPATARDIAKELGIESYDLKDPETNQLFGTHYLKKMLDMFDGDLELALTAYNQGPARVKRLLKETGGSSLSDIIKRLGPDGRSYAKKVLGKFDMVKA